MSKRPASDKSVATTKPPSNSDDLRTEIERQIGSLVGQSQRDQIVTRMTMLLSEQFSGPIAHPRHLRAYEEILPGSAERIVQMAEDAQDHNRKMEAKIVNASVWENKAGMVLGFTALLVLIGLAFWAGMEGNNILAGILLTSGLLGAATTLIRGWKNSS